MFLKVMLIVVAVGIVQGRYRPLEEDSPEDSLEAIREIYFGNNHKCGPHSIWYNGRCNPPLLGSARSAHHMLPATSGQRI
ncbi:unnamed protein product [Colias eurytheme]|nr:unnamed protein product [Colias eurytheme]